MKQILVATDLSKRSDAAMVRAVSLAKRCKAKLMVVHVIDQDLPKNMAGLMKKHAEKEIKEQLSELTKQVKIETSVFICMGESYREILRIIKKRRPNLVVLGMHRKTSAIKDFFIGTTVERIIRHTNKPALIVTQSSAKDYQSILVSTDFSPASRKATERTLLIAPDADYEFLHVYNSAFGTLAEDDIQEDDRKEILKTIKKEKAPAFTEGMNLHNSRWKFVTLKSHASRHIVDECKRLKADLLVIGTNGRTGISNELLGSTAAKLLQNPPCDIFISKTW